MKSRPGLKVTVQDSNSKFAIQINKKILEVSGLRRDWTNKGGDWTEEQRREAEEKLER